MSKQEAKQIIETATLIDDIEDKKKYLDSALCGLRSVDFYEYFTRDAMRFLSRIYKVYRRAHLDKWELCEGVDKIVNDL